MIELSDIDGHRQHTTREKALDIVRLCTDVDAPSPVRTAGDQAARLAGLKVPGRCLMPASRLLM